MATWSLSAATGNWVKRCGGYHFLARKRQGSLRSSHTGQNLFSAQHYYHSFSHLSSCQREKQDTQGPPISSMVVRPSTQDLWGYRFKRYLSLTSVGYLPAQRLPTSFSFFLTHVLKSATDSIGSSSLGQVAGQTKVCQFQMTYKR